MDSSSFNLIGYSSVLGHWGHKRESADQATVLAIAAPGIVSNDVIERGCPLETKAHRPQWASTCCGAHHPTARDPCESLSRTPTPCQLSLQPLHRRCPRQICASTRSRLRTRAHRRQASPRHRPPRQRAPQHHDQALRRGRLSATQLYHQQ